MTRKMTDDAKNIAQKIDQKRGFRRYLLSVKLNPETVQTEIERHKKAMAEHAVAINRLESRLETIDDDLARVDSDLMDLATQLDAAMPPTREDLLQTIARLEAQLSAAKGGE